MSAIGFSVYCTSMTINKTSPVFSLIHKAINMLLYYSNRGGNSNIIYSNPCLHPNLLFEHNMYNTAGAWGLPVELKRVDWQCVRRSMMKKFCLMVLRNQDLRFLSWLHIIFYHMPGCSCSNVRKVIVSRRKLTHPYQWFWQTNLNGHQTTQIFIKGL